MPECRIFTPAVQWQEFEGEPYIISDRGDLAGAFTHIDSQLLPSMLYRSVRVKAEPHTTTVLCRSGQYVQAMEIFSAILDELVSNRYHNKSEATSPSES